MQVKEARLEDEVEFDTLSLSDLPLYSDDHDDLQRGEYEQQEEISQNEEDFEFSSQELTCSNTIGSFPQDNIVFCGKLIADKPNLPEKASNLIEHEHQTNETKNCAWGLLRWNFSLRRTRTKRRVLFSTNKDKSSDAIMHKNNKIQVSKWQKNKKLEREYHGFSGHDKVSILTSSSSGKVKWYLFLFGVSSFSTKIELRDMKNRLRRSSGHSSSRISPPTFGFQNYVEEDAACKGRSRGWGLLELIKTLNCGRN